MRTGAASKACNGLIYLHKIAQDGAYGKHYVYYGKNASDTFGPGWYLIERDAEGKNLVKSGEVTINPGEGLMVYSGMNDNAAKFVISGGVKLEPFSGKIKNKYQFGGNCTPVTIDLSKVKCLKPDGTDWLRTGAASKACNGLIYLHKIAQDGAYGKHYVYYGKNASDTFGPGWYLVERDAEGKNIVKEGDVTFAPGEGWLMYSGMNDDAALLELPKPIPDAE